MAFQSALTLTSQNLANASTPFYSRRMVNFVANPFNNGVSVGDVRRMADDVANQSARVGTSNVAGIDVYLSQLKNLLPTFDKADSGIGKSLTDSLSALEKLNTQVSIENRGLYLGQLNDLVSQFQNLSSQLNQAKQTTSQQLTVDVGQVNHTLQDLQNINNNLAQPLNSNNPDLLDKRDSLLAQLSKYFNFVPQCDEKGAVTVSLSNGMYLLAGNQIKPVVTIPNPANPQELLVGAQDGPTTSSIMDFIQAGELKGLTSFQTNVLDVTLRGVNRLAMGIAQSFNQQNKLGMDANGNLGGNIFSDINSATAIADRVVTNLNNTGTSSMTVNITDMNQLTTSDYQLSMGAANSYVLTRLSDQTVVSSGTLLSFPQAITVDGFSITVNNATYASGDSFVISPTSGGTSNFNLASHDPSLLALGWPVMASASNQAPGSTGVIKVTGVTDTTNTAFSTPKALNPPVNILFVNATTYQLVNASTGQVIEGSITYNPATGATVFPTPGGYDPGYRVSITGDNQAGDSFAIGYNTNTTDNRNGLALAKLYQAGALSQGSLSFNQAYSFVSNNIAMETSKAKSDYDAASIIQQQAQVRRDAISGVSLEEETMSLSEYQQYYQASAQILATARSVFDTIMEATRR